MPRSRRVRRNADACTSVGRATAFLRAEAAFFDDGPGMGKVLNKTWLTVQPERCTFRYMLFIGLRPLRPGITTAGRNPAVAGRSPTRPGSRTAVAHSASRA